MPVNPALPTVWADTETFSRLDLIKHGAPRYFRHPTTECLLFLYAIDPPVDEVGEVPWWNPGYGAPVECWDLTVDSEPPADLAHALDHPERYNWVFQNLPFDFGVLEHCLGVVLPIENCWDTAAQARSCALPAHLDGMTKALGAAPDQGKLASGKKLINRFSKPAPANHKADRYDRHSHPAEWADFIAYGKQDVAAMRWAAKKMPRDNYTNFRHEWLVTWRVNQRGIPVDIELIEALIAAVDKYKVDALETMRDITGLDNPNSVQQLQSWLAEHGVVTPDLRANTLKDILDEDRLDPDAWLSPEVRHVLQLRISIGRTPTKKLDALLNTHVDGRVYDALVWCGASRTGRFSSRGINLQNIPRGQFKSLEVEQIAELVKAGIIDLFYDDIMEVATSMIRGVIVAPPGKKLVVSDLSAIESVVLAYLAGEKWKIDAFHEIFGNARRRAEQKRRGEEPEPKLADIYMRVYAAAFAIDPETVDKSQRQQGKVNELAAGFEGGVGALVSWATLYRLDLDALWPALHRTAPEWVLTKSLNSWTWAVANRQTKGLSEDAYRASYVLIHLWRASHPATVVFWKQLEDNVKAAIKNPGKVYRAGRYIKIVSDDEWLRIKLPSGRVLYYREPRLKVETRVNYGLVDVDGTLVRQKTGERQVTGIRYMGIDPDTQQWVRQSTYSGKIAENVTQAVARDVIVSSMIPAEHAGFTPIMSVHDETITEVDDDPRFDEAGLSALLTADIPWAPGLPLGAAGFEGYRYRKD